MIANLRVIRYQETKNEQENSSGLTIDGLHVDCAKNVNLSPWPWSFIFGVSKYHKPSFNYVNSCRSSIEGLEVDFPKTVNFILCSSDFMCGGNLASGTHLWALKLISIYHWGSECWLCKNWTENHSWSCKIAIGLTIERPKLKLYIWGSYEPGTWSFIRT